MKTTLAVTGCLCHNLRKTTRLLTQYYDLALRSSGLRITQFTLLAAIAAMQEASFVPLADFLGMDRTTLTRNLDLLERDGWVRVSRGQIDRRQQIVRLTGSGAAALDKAMPLWEQAQRKALRAVGKGDVSSLMAQLGRLSTLS